MKRALDVIAFAPAPTRGRVRHPDAAAYQVLMTWSSQPIQLAAPLPERLKLASPERTQYFTADGRKHYDASSHAERDVNGRFQIFQTQP